MKRFSRQEILEHNKPGDCWIIIDNSIYDITSFITKHPGGSEILESRVGEDATSYFVTKHRNNKRAIEQLSYFKIGEVIESEKILCNDNEEPFLSELIDRCYKAKLYQPPLWRSNCYFYTRLLNIVSFFTASIVALYAPVHWSIAVLLVFGQAIIGTSLFGLVAHEATHRNFPKNPILKKLMSFSWPIFWPFIVENPLRFEHNSHHIKIGDAEFDYEVAGFAPLIRYSGNVKHTFFHKYQHKLAFCLYPFYGNIITTIGAYYSGYWEKHNRADLSEQAISLLQTALYYIVIPSLINGSVFWYLLLYLIYQCGLFYGIYIGAAINHFIPSIMKPIPKEHENKYAYYVCHNTSNFSLSSRFWFWYTGGFNIQIEHHLIPFIPVDNLHKMVSIVKELCRKYNYPYHEYRNFRELWNDHYSYLHQLSQKKNSLNVMKEIQNKHSYQAR